MFENQSLMEKIISLAKQRGFIFQSSEIYGGLKSAYDYGPLGVELKRNIKNFDQTKNEVEYRLEQLRALDNGIKINVALAKSSPIGIDTEEDYLALKKIMEYKS